MIWLTLLLLLLPIVWPHRWLVREGKRYLLRWPLLGGDGIARAPFGLGRYGTNCFLHLIIRDDPALHSHPWWARAKIYFGRYRDIRVYKLSGRVGQMHVNEYGPGDVNEIDDRCFHMLKLLTPFVITLCWTDEKHGRGWRFLIDGKEYDASGRGAAAYDEVVAEQR